MSDELDERLEASDDCCNGIVNGLSVHNFFEKLCGFYEPPGVRFREKFRPHIILSQEALDAFIDEHWRDEMLQYRKMEDGVFKALGEEGRRLFRKNTNPPTKFPSVKTGRIFNTPFSVGSVEDKADECK